MRDFIHVVDLATGHLAALQALTEPQCFAVNLGTGNGYSVLDVVKAYEKACGKPIPYTIAARRPGDIASCYADPAEARRKLGWEAKLGLDAMCADSWRWQQGNPNGFKS